MANRFGLQRHIPENIALEVRRRSKFGCVMCRCAIYQYEHIDPEYADAEAHEPDKICLLCGGCHDRVTRGRLSKETVKARYLEVQRSNEIHRPFEDLDLSAQNICVEMGTAVFEYARHLLRINGHDLLSITPPKNGSAFPTLNGVFCDHTGREIFRITDNIWEGPNDAWDIRVIGTEVTVKSEGNRIALAFRITPPDKIAIGHLNMYLDNCHIVCGDQGIWVGQVYETGYTYIGIGKLRCQGAEIGVDVDSRGVGPPAVRGVNMTGGEGVVLDGTGIRIAVGAVAMNIGDLEVWVQ
ncbi:hypothetical protein [Candidatus Accumulibacter contiguus]|jgi:hypothetical protein|nr:hypothetical protein [Candidatus Accumulibacter contiguus]NMQ07431.1 hypothetical protein [Candidatus Accumulibacter contiguus]